MSLSPKEVKNRKFHQSLTGYDTKEVGLFLKDVAVELEKLSMRNLHLSEANKALDKQVAQLRVKISLSPNRHPGSGRETGGNGRPDALLHEARLKAEDIVRQARTDAAAHLAAQEEEAKRKSREAARTNTAQAREEAASLLRAAREEAEKFADARMREAKIATTPASPCGFWRGPYTFEYLSTVHPSPCSCP